MIDKGCDVTGSSKMECLGVENGESAARPSWCLSCFFLVVAGDGCATNHSMCALTAPAIGKGRLVLGILRL